MKCPKCSKYTMEDKCSECNIATINPKPAKFSNEDKYGSYRRKAKGLQ
jgi:rRNA maturation protein Nop10